MMFISAIEILPVNVVQLMLASIMLFTVCCLFHQPKSRGLVSLFIFQASVCLMNILEGSNITTEYYLLTPIFTLLFGPVLYFFVRSLVNEQRLIGKDKWLHFIAAAILLPFTEHTQVIILIGSISQLCYLLLSFKLLQRYQRSSKAAISDADNYQLNWTVCALAVFAFIIITDLIRMNLQLIVDVQLKQVWYFVNEVLLFFVFSYLAFKVIKQPNLFEGMRAYEQQVDHQVMANEQEELAMAEQVFAAIDNEINSKALYNKPRFSIAELATGTGFKIKDISWAINQVAKRNFSDYINHLRVLAVKEKLTATGISSENILNTAFSCGFNSKSSFNAAFKRELGVTPSQYLKRIS